jgi:hypothetical protein
MRNGTSQLIAHQPLLHPLRQQAIEGRSEEIGDGGKRALTPFPSLPSEHERQHNFEKNNITKIIAAIPTIKEPPRVSWNFCKGSGSPHFGQGLWLA